jgi:hypothetical protein
MATTVPCDNPNCAALYEVSSFLGGHTFTCNKCGSRVTIRDLSYTQPRQAQSTAVRRDRTRHGRGRFPMLVPTVRFGWVVVKCVVGLVAGVFFAYLMTRN